MENGSLVDEDEEDPEDPDDPEGPEGVNGVGESHSRALKTPRKRSLMDTIAKLSGSAKKKQINV